MQPFQQPQQRYVVPPETDFLKTLIDGASSPISTTLKFILDRVTAGVRSADEAVRVLKEMRDQANRELARAATKGFTRHPFRHPGGETLLELTGSNIGQGVRALTLVTVPIPTGTETAEQKVLYVNFGREMEGGPTTVPTTYDAVLAAGGKLAKYTLPRGASAIKIRCGTPLVCILYATSGPVENLPDV